MLRKPFERLRLSGSKTRRFCPSESKAARFQASLSSPFGRGTMPAQPSIRFFHHSAFASRNIIGLCVFETPSLIYYFVYLLLRKGF